MKKASLISILLIGFGCIANAQTVTIGRQVMLPPKSENSSITGVSEDQIENFEYLRITDTTPFQITVPVITINGETITTDWSIKNLNVSTFRNGDPIPQAKTEEEWEKAGENEQPAWCYYENDPANGAKYGKLYNWYAVNDPRGLAPIGWHIPSAAEWTVLTDYLGGEDVAGTKMKSTSGWEENGNGTNSSGFNALPGGSRSLDGSFANVGYSGIWWSSSEGNAVYAWGRYLNYFNGIVGRLRDNKGLGFSVRCLRD